MKRKLQVGGLLVIAVVFILGAIVFDYAGRGVTKQLETTDQTINAGIESATVQKTTVCVDILPNPIHYDPNSMEIRNYCAPVNAVEVRVNADQDGTRAEIRRRHNVPNDYGIDHYSVTDSMVITVRTEAQRAQYVEAIEASKRMTFAPRDVALTDMNKPSAD